MIQVYGRTQPLARYPIEQCLGVIRDLGFDGVEICLENEDIAPALLDDGLIQHVRSTVEQLGFESFSISYHKDYVYNDEELQRTIQAIQATPRFGADVFVFSGTRKRTRDQAEWERMLDRTKALVSAAQECGVVLAKEFEPDFIVGSTAELLALFQEIPSPHLAANLDLGHVFLCDPDPMQAIRDLGTKIVHVHIENMGAGLHKHLPPWEGDMDLAQYVQALRAVGFDGGAALDLYMNDYEQVAGRAVQFIKGLLA